MWRSISILLVLLAIAACGKNDGLRTVPMGPAPMGMAPAPYGYSPYNPGYAPNPQYGNPAYGNPYFTPGGQVPNGYGQGFYPFMPIYNYMQSNPYTQNYWGGFWNGWQNYANQNGHNQYNFPAFWYDYCPQQWGGNQQWNNMYNYYNTNFYFWMTPQTQFQPSMSPNNFWQNYNGYSYAPLNNYGYCNDYCGYY